MGEDAFGINRSTIVRMTDEIAEVAATGVELAIVIGGGNIFRGVAPGAQGMDRATADYMGMMATIMNALALQDALKHKGIDTRVQSALNIDQVVEPYIRPKALRYLEEGKVVIFAAGTGNPSSRPTPRPPARRDRRGDRAEGHQGRRHLQRGSQQDPTATRYARISFDEAIVRRLEVMDATAFALCRDQKLPIKVFSINKSGALKRVVSGDDEGTLVHV